jgi:hypothetical protein
MVMPNLENAILFLLKNECVIKHVFNHDDIIAQAKKLWGEHAYSRLSNQNVSAYMLDMCFSMGSSVAHIIAQRAVWGWDCRTSELKDDGILDDNTINLINHHSAFLIAPLRAERASYYRVMAHGQTANYQYLERWLDRTYSTF